MASSDEEAKQETTETVDPWAEAFAALEPEVDDGAQDAEESTEQQTGEESTDTDTDERAGDSDTTDDGQDEHQGVATPTDGGSVSDEQTDEPASDWGDISLGGKSEESELEDEPASFYTEEQATEVIKQINTDSQRAAVETAVQQLKDFRSDQGGAIVFDRNGGINTTIDDHNIMQYDDEGMPVFVNPDTGREFSGDDPRSQAQQWVNGYNARLRQVVNDEANKVYQDLRERTRPQRELIAFEPTWAKLDDTRKMMLDAVIEDYEIKDNAGNVVGYNCDLNQKLADVNRQVRAIQASRPKAAPKQDSEPTQPATDMKTSGTPTGKDVRPEPKNLAEALEMLQTDELEKGKK